MKVFTIWGSEDEGFRFPFADVAYATLTKAVLAAGKAGGAHIIPFEKKDLDNIGAPTTHGEVVVLLTYDEDVKSIDDAVKLVRHGNPGNLYALDWMFIVSTEVVD